MSKDWNQGHHFGEPLAAQRPNASEPFWDVMGVMVGIPITLAVLFGLLLVVRFAFRFIIG